METAKIFENGRSQAVRLPKKFRFNVEEVVVQQLGDAVLLVPKESLWQTFMDGLNSFTSDIFEKVYDLYAGHKYLHLCNEEKTGACAAAISRRNGWRNLHFFHYTGGAGVWNET